MKIQSGSESRKYTVCCRGSLTRLFSLMLTLVACLTISLHMLTLEHEEKRPVIPVYVINLPSSVTRREHMAQQLEARNIPHHRIEAFGPKDVRRHVHMQIQSLQSHLTPNKHEIACIASHLVAIHTAVNDVRYKDSPYALIMEDDVEFQFDIDFAALASHAPKGFGVLQLMTSNAEVSMKMFDEYKQVALRTARSVAHAADNIALPSFRGHSNTKPNKHGATAMGMNSKHNIMWKPHEPGENLWSTQAYLIKKSAMRWFVNKAVIVTGNTTNVFILQDPHLKLCARPPCMYPFRIVTDIYLYSVLGRTYVSKIPLFNGRLVSSAGSSHIQGDNRPGIDESNSNAFQNLSKIIGEVKQRKDVLLPYYIRVDSS